MHLKKKKQFSIVCIQSSKKNGNYFYYLIIIFYKRIAIQLQNANDKMAAIMGTGGEFEIYTQRAGDAERRKILLTFTENNIHSLHVVHEKVKVEDDYLL